MNMQKISKNTVKIISIFTLALCLIFLVLTFSACSPEEAAIAAVSGFAGVWICFAVISWLVGIFFFVIWIIALIDCIKRDNADFPNAGESTKLLWILIIVLVGGIGAIIYYFLVMKKMPRKK